MSEPNKSCFCLFLFYFPISLSSTALGPTNLLLELEKLDHSNYSKWTDPKEQKDFSFTSIRLLLSKHIAYTMLGPKQTD